MKNFYTSVFVYLLLVMSIVTKAQVTPNQDICPGTTVTYSITSSVFAGKNLNWTVTNGIFTNTNSTVSNNASSSNIIKWNNNISSGSFTVTSTQDGTSETFQFNVIPITSPYSADNISAVCGSTSNVQTEIRINQTDASGSQAQGGIAARSFTLPAGVSYVSNTYIGLGSEFGQTYLRYRVTFSINETASGLCKFKSFYSCSSDANSMGILSSDEISFGIRRTGSTSPSVTGNLQGYYNQSGSYSLANLPSGASVAWSATGPLLIGENTPTNTTINYGGSNGIGSVIATITDVCQNTIASQLTVGVGVPTISNVLVDNVLNSGPVAVNSGSTHYVQATSSNDPNANYSLSASTNSGNIVLNLTGINAGNCQINVSGSIGNASLAITASNSCGTYTRYATFYIPSGYRVASNPAKDNMSIVFDDVSYQDALPDQLELLSEKEGKALQTIDIKDMYAKKSFKSGNQVVFDIHNYPRGIYYLRVTNPRRTDDKKVDVIRLAFE